MSAHCGQTAAPANSAQTTTEMTSYLQEFFELIENKRAVSMAFIDEARVN